MSLKIINQLRKIKYTKNNLFSYKEKGLSKSRNRALLKATKDICLISDDVIFKNDME